nr:unnamed protein product [Callosobruchus chinensis]
MDRVDEAIILSLKQDLRILSELVEDITRRTKECDIKCWLFPTKDICFFKEFIDEYNILEGNNRKVYLELILDRFYVGIHLILRYIQEQIGCSVNAFEKSLFLHKPKQVTLGCSFDNLWKTIQQVVDQMASKKNISERNGFNVSTSYSLESYGDVAHKTCQTDIVSLNRCDSCASAVSCMKNLLLSLENDYRNNCGGLKKMRPKLYDVTQFGCMLQTTSTVEEGLRNMYKRINDYENKIEQMTGMHKKIEQDNSALQRKATFLEQQMKVYKDRQDKDAVKLQYLTAKNEDLTKEMAIAKKKITEQAKLLKQYVVSLEAHENIFKKVSRENINLKYCYTNISEELKSIIKESETVHKNMAHIEQETKSIYTHLANADDMIESHNRMLKNCSRVSYRIAEKVSNMRDDCKEEFDLVSKKFQELKEQIKEKVAEIRSANRSDPSFPITGNPAEDISKQIQANDERIKTLQNENKKLSIIVSKFYIK